MSDARPNDFNRPGLSRVMPCFYCEHEEHVLECQALIDLSIVDVHCPCQGVPVPGIYPTVPRASRFRPQ